MNQTLRIDTSAQAVEAFSTLRFEAQEVFSGAFVRSNNSLIAVEEIFRGTLTEVVAQPREVLRAALKFNAAKFLVAHNHVSGELVPSESDARFTVRLQWAAQVVGLEFLDHLIIGDSRYVSFADEGWLSKLPEMLKHE